MDLIAEMKAAEDIPGQIVLPPAALARMHRVVQEMLAAAYHTMLNGDISSGEVARENIYLARARVHTLNLFLAEFEKALNKKEPTNAA